MPSEAPVKRLSIAGLLKWLLSILFLALVASAISTRDMARLLAAPNLCMLLMSLGITGAMIAVSCWKWHYVLRQTWSGVRFWFLVRVYLIGYFFSNLLPSVVGGDFARITYVGRASGDMAGGAVSVFVERFTGILVLLLLAICAPALMSDLYSSPYIIGSVLLAVVLLVSLVLAVLCRLSPNRRAARFVVGFWNACWNLFGRLASLFRHDGMELCGRMQRGIERRIEAFLSKLGDVIRWIRNDRSAVLTVLLQTLLFYGLTWANVYVALRVFGVSVSFFSLCAVVPAIMLVAMIPVSQASIGLAEGCYVVYLGLLGIGREEALAAALLLRLKFLLVGLIGFVIYHLQGVKFSEIRSK